MLEIEGYEQSLQQGYGVKSAGLIFQTVMMTRRQCMKKTSNKTGCANPQHIFTKNQKKENVHL